MGRVLVSAVVALAVWAGPAGQELPVLRLKATLLDAERRQIPVARHALLISDDPVTTAPRRVVTLPDGTAQIRLRPGRYVVESDRPFVYERQTYEWMQTVDVKLGQDAVVELTAANAHVAVATNAGLAEPVANSPLDHATAILTSWQASAFELWTPHVHAAGFLADERGLVATSLRALVLDPARGAADVASVEVQISPSMKVIGAVIVADAPSDVAIVRVHPSAIGGIRPVPIACDAAMAPAEAERYVIGVPLFGPPNVESSFVVSAGAAGGPVFAPDGRAIGLSSPAEQRDASRSVEIRIVGAASICEALRSARAKLDAASPPDAMPLPVEPTRSAPGTAASSAGGSFSLTSYQLSSSDFDLTFLTPSLIVAAAGKRGWTGVRAEELSGLRVATEFENWSAYVVDAPPLLFVRATPRLVESFWMKVARGAASTQGAALPPIKRMRPGFSRMRLLCGGKDVTPIHPFRIQARVTETDAIEEGFYAFDPAAIGPACGTVSIVVSSVKDPNRTETRTVDPVIIRRVSEDFASIRTAAGK